MLIVASDAHRVHHPHAPLLDRGLLIAPPEIPERVDRILAAIADARLGDPHEPRSFGSDVTTAVHPPEYVEFLEHAHARWCDATGLGEESEATGYARPVRDQPPAPLDNIIAALGWYSHDRDPILSGTYAAAVGAVDVTLTAWEAIADGHERTAYALARPPGHHAAADSFAGYCYFNNVAVAAQTWTARGARVAIVDVDYHHGNGTQQIFYARDDVLFVSLHGDPAFEYPFFLGFADETGTGAGHGYNRNYPLPFGTDWNTYPRIGAALAALDRPTLVVQEGGYCLDVLGRNVVGVLRELD